MASSRAVPNPIPTSGPYLPGVNELLVDAQWASVKTADPPEDGSINVLAVREGYQTIVHMMAEMENQTWDVSGLRTSDDVRVINAVKKAYEGIPVGTEFQAIFAAGDIVTDANGENTFPNLPTPTAQQPVTATTNAPYVPTTMSPADQTALRKLFALIEEVNGQDAYSVTAMALGRLKNDEFLVLPESLRGANFATDAADVGTSWDIANSPIGLNDFANIYALNRAVGADTKDPVFFGLVRAEAVKMGWFNGQAEVRYAIPPPDALDVFIRDTKEIEDNLESARTAAFLIPFMNEYVFRTTGHHFLTGLIDDYDRKYQALCSACLAPDMTRKLRSAELWHKAMHWVSPERTRAVINALNETARLPNAIRMRKDAAPAGTAIVTTTCAVIEALESCNWANEVATAGNFDFELIKDMTATIKADVTKYHTAYFAYGVAAPTVGEKARLEAAILEAQKFAPVAQGFVDAMYVDSSLGRAKALRKYADASPVLLRRAARVFRLLARSDTETIADIFKSSTAPTVVNQATPATTQLAPP